METAYELPQGWEWSTIGEACTVNVRDPRLRKLPDHLQVSFVPMAAVDAERGAISDPIDRNLGDVRKGLTPFADGDVIFARITPSMENGKAAIAGGLTNGLGFGSTEFHVMRPGERVLPEWVFHFVRQVAFRNEAKASFAGTAGQLRVPDSFVRSTSIPLPPLPEQQRIVEKIARLLEQSRTAREALDQIPPLLKRFRQAVLAKAFRGELTECDPSDEPAFVVLERIREERRRKWEEDLRARGKDPGKAKYVEPEPPDTGGLPDLPEGWVWASVAQIGDVRLGRQRSPSRAIGPNMTPYLRAANVTWTGLDLRDVKQMDFTPSEQGVYRLHAGDVVLSEASGSASEAGKPAIWRDEIPGCCFQNTLIRVRSHLVPAEYLRYHFLDDATSGRFAEATTGIGINHLGANGLSRSPFALAPLPEQYRIVATLDAHLAQVDAIEMAVTSALRRAEHVDQAILARAFRGEL